MLQIRPAIRLLILGGVFFVIFLNLVTYINSVSSLRNRQNSFAAEKEQVIIEKTGFESDVLKQTKDEVNSRQNQQSFIRINPTEIKRPIDLQRNPLTANPSTNQSTSTEVGIIGR